jgi:hypothetical protein
MERLYLYCDECTTKNKIKSDSNTVTWNIMIDKIMSNLFTTIYYDTNCSICSNHITKISKNKELNLSSVLDQDNIEFKNESYVIKYNYFEVAYLRQKPYYTYLCIHTFTGY